MGACTRGACTRGARPGVEPGSSRERFMPKMVKKGDLPTKRCAGCGLPFAWRKKWARDWEEVRYCSERCRGKGVN